MTLLETVEHGTAELERCFDDALDSALDEEDLLVTVEHHIGALLSVRMDDAIDLVRLQGAAHGEKNAALAELLWTRKDRRALGSAHDMAAGRHLRGDLRVAGKSEYALPDRRKNFVRQLNRRYEIQKPRELRIDKVAAAVGRLHGISGDIQLGGVLRAVRRP